MNLMRGLSRVFGRAVNARNSLYDSEFFKITELSVPVISVGNISVGGTGKTSFVIWMLRALHERGIKVGVVSRGYGGQIKSVAQVPEDGDPQIFGDEPCLIAREKFGPVFVGPKRSVVGAELLKRHQVDLLIADDAFQHRKLHRDIDVVLVDFSETPANWELLPYGRLREGFSSLERADVIVETKRNFGDQKYFSDLEAKLPRGKVRLQMDYRFADLLDFEGKSVPIENEKYFLVSGVAQPEGVEILAGRRVELADHCIFDDHHGYDTEDVREILQQMGESGSRFVLTTEKDAVKLSHFPELREYLRIMKLDYAVEGQLDDFYKILLRNHR